VVVLIQGQAVDTGIDSERLADRDACLVAEGRLNFVVMHALPLPLSLNVFLDEVLVDKVALVIPLLLPELASESLFVLLAARSWHLLALVGPLDLNLEALTLLVLEVVEVLLRVGEATLVL